MGCLTARDYAAARLEEDCTIVRPSRTSDDAGGSAVSETDVEETACRVTAMSSMTTRVQQEIADKLKGREGYVYALPFDADVKLGDRLSVDGRKFNVLSVSRSIGGLLTKGVCAE